MSANGFTRGEVCVVALAECFRGDGEILGNPIGNVPVMGGRLARATFEPDLVMTDTEARLVVNTLPVGVAVPHEDKLVEAWLPFSNIFDVAVWPGTRHIIMGPSQIDRTGNINIAHIGDWRKPKAQLLGVRGAPGNTINHTCSYWVPNHSTRSFVEQVDYVAGLGYERAAALPGDSARFHEIRYVVSNLGVFDFETPERTMRLRTAHPGVSVDEVVEATGFELVIPDEVGETRAPTDEEIDLIRNVLDPGGLLAREVPSPQ
jgi:acyl CoA:acetate/3-ketoacid CoA transferase beta subunit